MPLFDWIRSDLHNLNLDWIISKIKTVEESEQGAVDAAADAQASKTAAASSATAANNSKTAAAASATAAAGSAAQAQALVDQLDTTIAQDVSDWLENNLTPTSPPVDDTLTIQGAAADAKKTGDEISDLKTAITNSNAGKETFGMYAVFENGGLQSGVFQPLLVHRVATPNTFTVDRAITASVKSGYRFGVNYFENGSFSSETAWQTATYTIPADSEVKVVIAKVEEVSGTADISEFVNAVTFNTIVQNEIEALDAEIDSVNDEVLIQKEFTNNVVVDSVFNGTSSVCGVSPIILSQNGDIIEFKVKTALPRTNTAFYSFASRGTNQSGVAVAIATNNISVRSTDNTWVCSKNVTEDSGYRIIKIEYTDGNIITSVNGTAINTYNGLKTLQIDWFGKNSGYNYWSGIIEYVKVNGVKYRLFDLAGYAGTDISVQMPIGFLTEEQNQTLLKADMAKYTIIPTSSKVSVYFPISGNYYGKIEIKHDNDTSDANYVNYWRIGGSALCTSEDGLNFTETSDQILIGAENEMAVLFRGFDDHIGGWHGDERIDNVTGCYVAFIVDGKEYTISDLVTLGTVKCAEFAYREVSTLYAPYTYNANHLKVAKHTKITSFIDRGLKTKNYVEMDLSSFDQSTLKIASAYTGLFCIATPFAVNAVSDIGTIYTGVHPTTSVVLASRMNKYDYTAKTFNGSNSAEIDSKLIKTDISAFIQPEISVSMVDRASDLKYYSYLPADVDVQTGNYYAVESAIQWMIKND